MIGTGDLAARLAYHLIKTRKETNKFKAVAIALDYYRFKRDAMGNFDKHLFGTVVKAAASPVQRGKPRGARKEVVAEVA